MFQRVKLFHKAWGWSVMMKFFHRLHSKMKGYGKLPEYSISHGLPHFRLLLNYSYSLLGKRSSCLATDSTFIKVLFQVAFRPVEAISRLSWRLSSDIRSMCPVNLDVGPVGSLHDQLKLFFWIHCYIFAGIYVFYIWSCFTSVMNLTAHDANCYDLFDHPTTK